MKITIASGKGGTGKTTVATNLAVTLAEGGMRVSYIDCDVEEPNGHIFLKPVIEAQKSVGIPMPEVDEEKCTYCGKCAEICQFNAIVCIKRKILTFPELCHGCGGCALICPEGAIGEFSNEIGIIEEGKANNVKFIQGKLKVGIAMSHPLVHEVKKIIPAEGINIIDASPGTSCPVVEAMKGVDFVLLVTEPTPFGLNDLKLAVETALKLNLPVGILINRCNIGDVQVKRYCERNKINILMEISDDRRVAEVYSRGELIIKSLPEYYDNFFILFKKIQEMVKT